MIRSAIWTARALRAARSQLREDALAAPELPPVPDAPGGRRTVERVLYLGRGSCLENAVVRQAWLAARGRRRDLVIGVRGADDFAAHAWLDGEPPSPPPEYTEIVRRPA
jgi:Transglutaminase-like superfamily